MGKLIDKYGVRFVYILIFIIILIFFLWATYDYQRSVYNNLLSESKIIVFQVRAMKSYIQQEQGAINTDSQGGYEFKGVHPDAAVKRMSNIIEGGTGYFTIRQVSLEPRNEDNTPDKFEKEKLEEFIKDPGILELYDSGSIGGHKVFRYIVPLRADETCLPCHGGEKGDVDITGHKKEGFEVGDVIGGLSVIIRSYKKYQLLRNNMSVLLVFVFFLTFSIGLIINSLKNHFNKELKKAQRMERPADMTVTSDSFNAKLNEKFHRLMMHNMRNPISEVIDSAEMFKDVPLNILEGSLSSSNKISGYTSNLIELKKLEQGRGDILLNTFDFTSAFKAKVKVYEDIAMKNAIKFDSKPVSNILNVHSDKKLLLKALDYLFLSVLKFTRKETGIINIYLNVNTENNFLTISMINNSKRIGVDAESVIFEKFTDIKDLDGNFLFNTSIKLTIAKLIFNKLCCDLSFDSANRENNAFHVTIPLMSIESVT